MAKSLINFILHIGIIAAVYRQIDFLAENSSNRDEIDSILRNQFIKRFVHFMNLTTFLQRSLVETQQTSSSKYSFIKFDTVKRIHSSKMKQIECFMSRNISFENTADYNLIRVVDFCLMRTF